MTISTAAISQYTLLAPLIQINWQSTDRLSSSVTSTPVSSTTVSTSSSTATSAPSQGLSTGAKAGIGVGIALGALALLALAFFIYQKRRNAYARARQDSPAAIQPYELSSGRKGPYHVSEMPTAKQVSELAPGEVARHEGGPIYEMNG